VNAIALTAVAGALAGSAPAAPDDAVELRCRDRVTSAFTQVGDRVTPYRFRVRPRHDVRFGRSPCPAPATTAEAARGSGWSPTTSG
jgi:hypothetical protein